MRTLPLRERRVLVLSAAPLICLALLGGVAPALAETRSENAAAAQAKVQASYGELPLQFEANRGQANSRVKFLSRGRGYTLFLTSTEAVLAMLKPAAAAPSPGTDRRPHAISRKAQKAQGTVLRMGLVGANPAPKVTGAGELPGKVNYFVGNDPAQWRTSVSTYGKVRYQNIYPGVDLVYYGNGRQLEYDFVVAPGADPKKIALVFQGADTLRIDSEGDLVLESAGGQIRLRKPLTYQEVGGVRKEVAAGYVLKGKHRVGFQVAGYDASSPLIIDPVLDYSTFLGGQGNDSAASIAVDSAGNAYVTGTTDSIDFPTTGGAQSRSGSGAFVTKMNPAGSALVYSSYLGGGDPFGSGLSIAVDNAGNAYVAGGTSLPDFPTTPGSFQTTFGGGFVDAFVTKLDAFGSALVYSTYLGGGGMEQGAGIAVDSDGNAFVTGGTDSTDFPTTPGAFQDAFGSGFGKAYVTKLNPAGSALVYSTYLGGTFSDFASRIAVDSAGSAYVTGATGSSDFPTTPGAFQTTFNFGFQNIDAFVTKLNPAGSGLSYSTFLGGDNVEFGSGIAVDAAGNAYVAGTSQSRDFPTTPEAFLRTNPGGSEIIFVTKLNAAGTAPIYSTLIYGVRDVLGTGLAVDGGGKAHVTGITFTPDFPTTPDALQPAGHDNLDGVMAILNPAGSALAYSTYLGGAGGDVAAGIAMDAAGNPYVAGSTSSRDFPTTPGAFQGTYGSDFDPQQAFVLKFSASVVVNRHTLFLHGTGSNPPVLFLNENGPTSLTPRSKDSAGVAFAGGNPWKEIGTWTVEPGLLNGSLIGLEDALVFVGLKNSDDEGTRFDVRAEVYKNGVLVSSGQTFCKTGITRNPDRAREVVLSFSAFQPETILNSDVVSLKVLDRIGTNGFGSPCGGHGSALGLRLYFDSGTRPARLIARTVAQGSAP